MISGNMIGSYSQMGKTLVLSDESGVEITGVIVGQETIFDATDNDVREGKTYASDSGVSTGTKVIPAYTTHHGYKAISKGSSVKLYLPAQDCYDYTVFHGFICDYNTTVTNSVAAQQIVVYDSVFNVQSADVVATLEKDHDTKTIIFNITNNSGKMQILRYITYKEII